MISNLQSVFRRCFAPRSAASDETGEGLHPETFQEPEVRGDVSDLCCKPSVQAKRRVANTFEDASSCKKARFASDEPEVSLSTPVVMRGGGPGKKKAGRVTHSPTEDEDGDEPVGSNGENAPLSKCMAHTGSIDDKAALAQYFDGDAKSASAASDGIASLRIEEDGEAVVDVRALLKTHPEIEWDGGLVYTLKQGYISGMKADARFYANHQLLQLVLSELRDCVGGGGAAGAGGGAGGGFLPAVKQLANVATLPGVVGSSVGMPDIHSGYGFAIGNVAAMDLDDPDAVVSPGGVGFDINCGVRLLRSDLTIDDVSPGVKKQLADELFRLLPVGVGDGSVVGKLNEKEMDEVLSTGMKWAERKGLCWPSDRELVEEGGCFAEANPADVSARAKARGRTQCGSLGSGNHYAEVQVKP